MADSTTRAMRLAEEVRDLAIVKLRRIFLGSMVLITLTVCELIFMCLGILPSNRALQTFLLPMLLWTTVVTAYAFHAIFTLAAQRHRQIQDLANRDGDWAAYTAAYLHTRLEEEQALAMKTGRKNAVVYLRISGIEKVNGEFGYAAGDVTLKMLVDAMVSCLPWQGFIARLSGAEFAAFLPGETVESAKPLINAIRQRVREFTLDLGARGKVSGLDVIVNVMPHPSEGMTLENLILATRKTALENSTNHKPEAADASST